MYAWLWAASGVEVTCDVCDGRRFQLDVLDTRWRGLAPDALLEMTVVQAHALFADISSLARSLHALCRVGLGYLRLDHPLSHLSGGGPRVCSSLGSWREHERPTAPCI